MIIPVIYNDSIGIYRKGHLQRVIIILITNLIRNFL